MHHNVEFKNVSSQEDITRLIDELIARIDKRVESFPAETVFLRALIEKVEARDLWRVAVTLKMPGKIIADDQEKHEPHAALRAAFAGIERQIDEYKSRLRGEPLWKRKGRRKELKLKNALATPPD